jgi:DNA-binding HxlR family transcriptional regulator
MSRGSELGGPPIPTVADILRLLGSGPNGSILLALGSGPLRTRRLTERIPSCAPRTIYRHLEELERLGLVERRRRPGVPSNVTYSLTQPSGRDLFRLLENGATPLLGLSPDAEVEAPAWAPLALLGELWETGLLEHLSCEPRSATELARRLHGLSLHQIGRRARRLSAAGLLEEQGTKNPGTRFSLTPRARHSMALVAGLGRWRRHVVPEGTGLTAAEMAMLLRVALPLLSLPEHAGDRLVLSVVARDEYGEAGAESLLATVGSGGEIRCQQVEPEADSEPSGWARATVRTWLVALLDDGRGRMRVGGDLALVGACLTQLHDRLWEGLNE